MIHRSLRAEVRNRLFLVPAAKDLAGFPPDAKWALRQLLLEIRADARTRAETRWAQHKAPMAAYLNAVGVHAKHAARLLREAPDEAR